MPLTLNKKNNALKRKYESRVFRIKENADILKKRNRVPLLESGLDNVMFLEYFNTLHKRLCFRDMEYRHLSPVCLTG